MATVSIHDWVIKGSMWETLSIVCCCKMHDKMYAILFQTGSFCQKTLIPCKAASTLRQCEETRHESTSFSPSLSLSWQQNRCLSTNPLHTEATKTDCYGHWANVHSWRRAISSIRFIAYTLCNKVLLGYIPN